MTSHNGDFQTDDNWNMQYFSINGYSDLGQSYYMSANGDPVKRFTGSDPWWTQAG